MSSLCLEYHEVRYSIKEQNGKRMISDCELSSSSRVEAEMVFSDVCQFLKTLKGRDLAETLDGW